MLTVSERRRGIGWGLLSLFAIALFVGVAVAALASLDAGDVSEGFFTVYTWRTFRFTLLQAILSTLLSVMLALPVTLALARQQHFAGRIWIIRLLQLPMGLPVLIGALGIIGIWGTRGLANGLLREIGLDQPVNIYGLSGILLGHAFFNMPLATRLMVAALERLPAEYWLLSTSLGMKAFPVFRFIEWPAVRRVIPGIASLIFMLCATSFTLVLILGGGPAATTLEVAIYQALRFDFDPQRAIALSLLQLGTTGLLLALMARFPAPDDVGGTGGRPLRRFDGSGFGARLWDWVVIGMAVAFLLLPLASIVVAGLRADLWSLATSPAFLQATMTSLTISLAAGLLAVMTSLAIIAAREAIADMRNTGSILQGFSGLLDGVASLVLLVPPVVLGAGWFLILIPYGDVRPFAPILLALINTLMALPFVMRVLAPAVQRHRHQTARVAASLGIGGLARLWWVDRPALTKPLLTALSFAMALSLGDLGAVALFGSNDFVTLPWLVYGRLASYRTTDADGLALLLGGICLVLTILGTAGRREAQRV